MDETRLNLNSNLDSEALVMLRDLLRQCEAVLGSSNDQKGDQLEEKVKSQLTPKNEFKNHGS